MTNNEKEKQNQDKIQIILSDLLKDEDNKYCVDCNGKRPQWASWSLGIFLCIRCAGIHRNLGVHISRVKSVNLDSWTYHQVAMMKAIGNSRGRIIYEATLEDNFRRPQTDATMEQFIRSKYEHKRYIAKDWVAPNPSIDSVVDNIRELETNSHKKPTISSNNGVNVGRKQIPQGPAKTEIKKPIQVVNNNNVVDLLGLDNDDSFGDFVFASEKNLASTNATKCDPIMVSSSANDLIGLNLSRNDPMAVDTTSPTYFSSLEKPPTVNGQMDKNSILALYNNSSSSSSPAWPGIGMTQYQPDPVSLQSLYGHNQCTQSIHSFGEQRNPFFNGTAFHNQNQIQSSPSNITPNCNGSSQVQYPSTISW